MPTTLNEGGAEEKNLVKFDEHQRDVFLMKAIGLLVERMRKRRQKKRAAFYSVSPSTVARIEHGEISTPALITVIFEMKPCWRELRHYFRIVIKNLKFNCTHCRNDCPYDKTKEETINEVCGDDLTDDPQEGSKEA